MITSWSHSRYVNFSKCKFRAKLLYEDRLEEPRSPLKPGLLEYPNDKGNRLHEAAKRFVEGGVELLPELDNFREEFVELRRRYAAQPGDVVLEREWGFDETWGQIAYHDPRCCLRVKLDAFLLLDFGLEAVVIDYKTGKKAGNELKHAEQTQLYAACVAMREPRVLKITTELWYTADNLLTRTVYSREQALRLQVMWNARGQEIMNEKVFKPNPNRFSCAYCNFGPRNSGPCKVGYVAAKDRPPAGTPTRENNPA